MIHFPKPEQDFLSAPYQATFLLNFLNADYPNNLNCCLQDSSITTFNSGNQWRNIKKTDATANIGVTLYRDSVKSSIKANDHVKIEDARLNRFRNVKMMLVLNLGTDQIRIHHHPLCDHLKPGLRTIVIFNPQDWPYFLCRKNIFNIKITAFPWPIIPFLIGWPFCRKLLKN